MVLTGFTDNTCSPVYDLGLSRRRAESVEAYLVKTFDVSVGRIVNQWYGITNPVLATTIVKVVAKTDGLNLLLWVWIKGRFI